MKIKLAHHKGSVAWYSLDGIDHPFVKFHENHYGTRKIDERIVKAQRVMVAAPDLLAMLQRCAAQLKERYPAVEWNQKLADEVQTLIKDL